MVNFLPSNIQNWAHNAWDWITGSTGKNLFYAKNSYLLGQKGPVFIETDKANAVYQTIPQFKTVIDRKASMFSNMRVKMVDKDGNEVKDDMLTKLLTNPNPMQSQNDFLKTFKMQEQVYGNQFIYKNKPSALTRWPLALWCVSPAYTQPILSGKVFDQIKKEDIIIGYQYDDQASGQRRVFPSSDVLYSKINDLDNPVLGAQPILSLRFPLSNTKLAYEYRNVIMGEKGAIGILSNNSKDSMGAVPMRTDEKEKIERQYTSQYGVGADQRRIILTEASLGWQPMTYPTKDLLLFEEIDANFRTIIDFYGLNANVFSGKDSTYENVKQGIILSYQDTIIPESEQFLQALAVFIGVPPQYKLVGTFDHMAIMKEDESKGADAMQKKISSITQLVQAGVLTPEQAQGIIQNITGEEIDQSTASTINRLNRLSPLVANNVLGNLTVNELRALVGLSQLTDGTGDRLSSASPSLPGQI